MKMSHLGAVEAILIGCVMVGVVAINVAGLTRSAGTSPSQSAHACPGGGMWIPERNTCLPPEVAALANN